MTVIPKIDNGRTNPEKHYSWKVLQSYTANIDSLNKNFGNWRKIKWVELIAGIWTIDSNTKTKRNLLQNFAKTSTRRHTAKAKVIYKVPSN
jgi:hypothetical protein